LLPIFTVVKVVGLTETVATPQLSVEPLLMSDAWIEAVPFCDRVIVSFLHLVIGSCESLTVIVNWHELLPQVEVSLIVTVVVPTLKEDPG
jgi:hypothetical protein